MNGWVMDKGKDVGQQVSWIWTDQWCQYCWIERQATATDVACRNSKDILGVSNKKDLSPFHLAPPLFLGTSFKT